MNLDTFGTAEFSLVASYDGKSSVDGISSFANGFRPIADSAMGAKATKFTLGQQVDATGVFSTANVANGFVYFNSSTAGVYNWAPGDTGYMGFTFNPSGSTPLYGWAQISVAANPRTFTLVDYAYENAGASIATGQVAPVPEPSTTMLGALGLLGLAAFFRWRRLTAG